MEEKQKKNNYPWETLDTTTLMLPLELISYYLYRYEISSKNKRQSDEIKELKILQSYIQKETNKEVEVGKCFQK